jgi:addiction module HigA family antidote
MDRKYFDEVPIHPGLLVYEQFVEPSGLTNAEISRQSGYSQSAISRFFTGISDLSEDLAIELGLIFKVSPNMLLGLQVRYKLSLAMKKKIESEKQPPIERKSAV